MVTDVNENNQRMGALIIAILDGDVAGATAPVTQCLEFVRSAGWCRAASHCARVAEISRLFLCPGGGARRCSSSLCQGVVRCLYGRSWR
jgi:hypothetical protein